VTAKPRKRKPDDLVTASDVAVLTLSLDVHNAILRDYVEARRVAEEERDDLLNWIRHAHDDLMLATADDASDPDAWVGSALERLSVALSRPRDSRRLRSK
jgi:hypothetical protein